MNPEFSGKIFEKSSNIKFRENSSRAIRDIPCGKTEQIFASANTATLIPGHICTCTVALFLFFDVKKFTLEVWPSIFEMTKHFSYILYFCAATVPRRSRLFMLLSRFGSLLEAHVGVLYVIAGISGVAVTDR